MNLTPMQILRLVHDDESNWSVERTIQTTKTVATLCFVTSTQATFEANRQNRTTMGIALGDISAKMVEIVTDLEVLAEAQRRNQAGDRSQEDKNAVEKKIEATANDIQAKTEVYREELISILKR